LLAGCRMRPAVIAVLWLGGASLAGCHEPSAAATGREGADASATFLDGPRADQGADHAVEPEGGAGGVGQGGGGGAAGAAGGGGAGGAGGGGGAGGRPACLPCGASACPHAVELTIEPAAGGIVSQLKVEAPGLHFNCQASAGAICRWFCQSQEWKLDGDVVITVSAPGYATQTLDVHPVSPGACACCPYTFVRSLELRPTGAGVPAGGCCANLDDDHLNCGRCGRACPGGTPCAAGKCVAYFGACLSQGGGFSDCNAYCASIGQRCMPACGDKHDEAMNQWITNGQCPAPTYVGGREQYPPTVGGCADPLLRTADATGVASQRCCCGEP
jgi:hypothetical protein